MNLSEKIYIYWLNKKNKTKSHNLGILHKKSFFLIPFSLLIPSLFIILLFTIFPFIYSIIKSFSYNSDINDASSIQVGFEAYKLVASDPIFQISVRNSLIYAILALPLSLTFSILISSVIASLHKKWVKGFWQTVFFLPYVTNAVAISLAFVYLFDHEVGIINNIFGIKTKWLASGEMDSYKPITIILSYGIWKNLAFQVLIITTAMLAVDKTLYKAATIDGASKLKQFFRITLPSINKTINFLITVGILGGIKVFPLAIFENQVTKAEGNGGMTIMLYIYKVVQSGNYDFAGAATVMLFSLGVVFSTVLKNTFKLIIYVSNKLGERNVLNKIKNSKFVF
ncbi:carbohydrate ABC transporter permease [Mesomycoplasma neurolyticum]|uniref:sn-glycerol-3-phosphate transport system permease protein ugpA n=1 Tax=Mesomycoplasma neurolyticum TaxID=2120 RepID=A0A449A5T8_9BACT|nr:sugar ABC transporter permease [Mesomycoplasma neurolyticum]VEU59621.1 sn-glycerol-3-phosphate transport system permease protein ugpA [Mesomycoplasma neurolyticum]